MGEGGEGRTPPALSVNAVSLNEEDRRYLAEALTLAERARGHTHPNPLVGALIVKEGRVLGEGYHPRAGEPHAEVFALRQAGEAARGATAYVSLEPCNHTGRTPPCSLALLQAGVRRVVVAARDPNPKARGGLEHLRAAGVEVVHAGWDDEVKEQNLAFFTAVEKGRPFVRLKVAATLDGRVADHEGKSRWITGPEARGVGHAFRQSCAAVAVGVGTVLADDPRLNVRAPDWRAFPWMRVPPPRLEPWKVVFDTEARTPPGARIFAGGRVLILVGEGAPKARVETLRAAGAEVVLLPRDAAGRVELRAALAALLARGLNGLLVEGGPRLAGAFLAAGLVDRVSYFLAPRLLGEGRGAFSGFTPGLEGAPRLAVRRREALGEDLWMEAELEAS